MQRQSTIRAQVWTEHFLGTSAKCGELLELLDTMDGAQWRPDRWSECEPVRLIYGPEVHSSICSKWTEERGGRISNQIFFRKQKPFSQVWISSWRGKVPSLNSASLSFDAKAFSGAQGVDRLERIILGFAAWSQAVYATARHTEQMHWRVAQMTPLERLERLDWLTFFGGPYVELFGGEQRVLSAPCFSAQQVSGGVLLLAAPRPDSPEMTDSDQTLLALEQYLGADAFAGENYPETPCRIPKFDLSETVNGLKADPDKDDAPRPFEPIILRDTETGTPSAVIVLSKS
ncbi:MAG: hypothetical protein ACLPY1_01695 [Terracidiphilus sp.]